MRDENFPRLNWNYSEIKLGFFAAQIKLGIVHFLKMHLGQCRM
jgi:hypothetical protein